MHHFYLILSNPEHVVLSIWVGVVVPQVTGIQLVPVICENPPVSETSLQQKYNLSNFENMNAELYHICQKIVLFWIHGYLEDDEAIQAQK